MRLKPNRRVALGCLVLLSAPALAGAAPEKGTTPDPDQLVAAMCAHLKSLERFSYRAEVTDDEVYTGGKKLQFGFTTETFVERPNRLRVNAVGDLFDKQVYFDGKALTLVDPQAKVYASAEAQGDIEAALAKAAGQLRFRVPLGDLSSPKLCEHMGKGQGHALYVGPAKVGGVATEHLAFDRADLQYQLWITTGDKPLPVKILVNQKNLPTAPQWTAVLSDWKTAPKFKPDTFTFTPAPGLKQIKFAAAPAAPAKPAAPPAVTPDATPDATGAKP